MIFIELPIDEKTGRTCNMPIGTQVNVWYMNQEGTRFDFNTEIVGRQKGVIPVLLLKVPQKNQINRTQRRNYLRVDIPLEIAIKTMDTTRGYHFLTRTEDLSGGGLSFKCSTQYALKERDKISIWMLIPLKTGTIMHAYADAEITRCREPEADSGQKQQWISVKFSHISEHDQAKVVRVCYERQLELRKRGVIE